MHRLIDSIFREHEEWLAAGGEGALRVVQASNLMALVSRGLERAEADGEQAGYRRGLREGTELGRRQGRESHEESH